MSNNCEVSHYGPEQATQLAAKLYAVRDHDEQPIFDIEEIKRIVTLCSGDATYFTEAGFDAMMRFPPRSL